MLEFIEKHKNYMIALAILFVVVSLSETTYSLFLKADTTEEFNYNTGLLDLTFTEDKQIILENAFPTNDNDGVNFTPYNLTVKNTGTLTYLFDLKMLSNGVENSIDYKYIKVKVDNQKASTLFSSNNIIASNVIIKPGEEITFKIKVWLAADTPNNELGKNFTARITATGKSIYKTLDNSGANHPERDSDMIPVYYDETGSRWRIADASNMNASYEWYNYANQKWANVVTIKNSDKYIYDVTRNHDLKIDDIKYNDGNILINDKPFDIGLSNNNFENITNVFRIRFDEGKNRSYIISNGSITYYYDHTNNNFGFISNGQTVISNTFNIEPQKWYIVAYSYNGNNVTFYVNGNKISTSNIVSTINSNNNFKLGTNNAFDEVSKITIGDVLIYNRILKDNEIANNYRTSINVIADGLVAGYREFIPMTLAEYYLSRTPGVALDASDISAFYVWIPRFKYKLWNVTGDVNVDSYDAYHKGIDINFEKDIASTGVINCKNYECFIDDLAVTKVSSADNGKFYVSPAFRLTTKELSGFWVSKYEISTNDAACNKNDITGCTNSELRFESKADNVAWRNNYLSNYYQTLLKTSNRYHVIKNTEWAAISYLGHSKYGVCQNNICHEIEGNDTYISGHNLKDSTTGNIYGVFDMAGSALEYTMGNYADNNNLNFANTRFKDIAISNDDYDLYLPNTFILGDATRELSITDGIWYQNQINNVNEVNTWIVRGGNTTGTYKGIFSYSSTGDIASEYITTRITIK